jgi:exopolysaccharide biosynthesis protein
MHRRAVGIPIWLIPLLLATSHAFGMVIQTKQITKGIEHTTIRILAIEGPMMINVVKANPKLVEVATAMAGDKVVAQGPYRGRDVLTSIVKKAGAICGVNGDYFTWMGFPFGIQVSDGELLISPMKNKAAFAIMDDGRAAVDIPVFSARFTVQEGISLPISALNRQKEEGVVLYTPSYGIELEDSERRVKVVLTGVSLPIRPVGRYEGTIAEVTDGEDVLIPPSGLVLSIPRDLLKGKEVPKKGQKATIEVEVRSKRPGTVKWDKVVQAIGGGPIILKEGKPASSWREEGFEESFVRARHPRTAIGISSDGSIILLTVDGRQRWSLGATINDLTAILKQLGAVDAMNLDGGGATEMVIKDGIANNPSDGRERAIKNAVIVRVPTSIPSSIKEASISPSPLILSVGDEIPLSVIGMDSKGNPFSVDGRWIGWDVEGGKALLKPGGKLIGIEPGTGKIRCFIGNTEISEDLIVLPGPPKRMEWEAMGRELRITLMDPGYNPIPNLEVNVTLYSSGKKIWSDVRRTDEKGSIELKIPDEGDPDSLYVEAKGMLRRIRISGMLSPR